MPILHETRFYPDGLPIFADSPHNLEFLAHWHPDIEILLVIQGSLIAAVNQEKRVLEEGDILVCGSQDIHFFERSRSSSDSILLIFKPELIGHSMLWPVERRLSRNFVSPRTEASLALVLRNLVVGIFTEMEEKMESYALVARGRVMELCGMLERELTVAVDQAAPVATAFPALERMQRAFDYIYESSAYPISLADAAKAASMSPSYFSRVFARTAGSNFRTFLNQVRIEKAEGLMSSSPATMADIALECGFESVRTFNRAYRAIRGRTPGSSRRAAS